MSDLVFVQLRADVRPIKKAEGAALLVSSTSGAALRLSPIAEQLVPMLVSGARVDRLIEELHGRYPRARDVEAKVLVLLDQLKRSNLLHGDDQPKRARRQLSLPNPDRLARGIVAASARMMPVVIAIGLVVAIASVFGIVSELRTARFEDLGRDTDVATIGFAIALLFGVVMPLHELCHAIACRACGVAVSGAGVAFFAGLLPRPFVDTSLAYQVTGRRRFLIPLAGPLLDLVMLGAWGCVEWCAGRDGLAVPAVHAAFLIGFFMCIVNLSPLRESDGSRTLEALLDDDLARTAALGRPSALSRPRTIRIYRICSLAYMIALTATMVMLW